MKNKIEPGERIAAVKEVNLIWLRLIDRVNQASDDGYDVVSPDVLADAMQSVANAQIAAGALEGGLSFLDQIELFKKEYAAQIEDVDRRFPRRPKS